MVSGIDGRTRVLGLIADPVVQARSPTMANALLAREGLFGAFVLVPMQVPDGALASAVAGLRVMPNFAGAVYKHESSTSPRPASDSRRCWPAALAQPRAAGAPSVSVVVIAATLSSATRQASSEVSRTTVVTRSPNSSGACSRPTD